MRQYLAFVVAAVFMGLGSSGCDDGHSVDEIEGLVEIGESEPNNTIINSGSQQLTLGRDYDISGTISANDKDVFNLPISSNKIYWIVAETDPSSSLDISLKIVGSDGETQYQNCDESGSGHWEGTFIYSTGTIIEDKVYIVLTDANGTTSPGHVYWLRIRTATLDSVDGNEVEQNSIISQATDIHPGETLQGQISTHADEDFYDLNVSDPKTFYGVFVRPDPLSELDVEIGVVNEDGDLQSWSDSFAGDSPEFVITRAVSGEGRYVYVKESSEISSEHSSAGADAVYNITAVTLVSKYGN